MDSGSVKTREIKYHDLILVADCKFMGIKGTKGGGKLILLIYSLPM